ncbi:hypothetical protein C8A05DRAFT_37296 [Staphylotrichum tortipilum]|uniref:BTB domain-containing protein n=1 Tax=Staphylotrichum tortipilum TaxID=2831512 RepID=A0AAN6MFE7_9PEZI|nr:hypothetical protein C8A05DRAFT_37296 [Staphylotrichum longicolle]
MAKDQKRTRSADLDEDARPDAASAPIPQPLETITLDPDGDLFLRVGAELPPVTPCLFRVCSASLRRATPVWKAMLFGPFTEARPAHGGDWVVDLPEDNPETLCVLLNILHGAFANVPGTISLEFLCGVIVVADKYDLIYLIRPYVNTWADMVNSPPKDAYTTWKLGNEDWVSDDMSDLAFSISGTAETGWREDGQDINPGDPGHAGPPDMMEVAAELRLSLIQSLLDFYHAQVEQRLPPNTACKMAMRNKTDSDLCDAVILGCMWRRSQRAPGEPGLLPKTAAEYTGSANDLLVTLGAMFRGLKPPLLGHHNCNPSSIFQVLAFATKKNPSYCAPLQPHHIKQMEKHREVSGFSPT